MGGDEGVLLTDARSTTWTATAASVVLSTAIKKLGDVDLVLTGRQAVDWDTGVTRHADRRRCSTRRSSPSARVVSVAGGKVTVERVLPDAFETVEASLPAVVTVSNELGEPRYPKLPQIMAAGKKQVTTWSAADLGLDAGALGQKLTLEALYVPVVDTKVEIMEGDTPEEQAMALAKRLKDAKLI